MNPTLYSPEYNIFSQIHLKSVYHFMIAQKVKFILFKYFPVKIQDYEGEEIGGGGGGMSNF
jgi:hypothetical protein